MNRLEKVRLAGTEQNVFRPGDPDARRAAHVPLGGLSALPRADLTSLPGSTKSFQLVSGPAELTLSGRKMQKFVYRFNAGNSEVTGKPLDLVGVRYYIPKDSSTVAVLNYGIVSNQYDPEGADDVARTFQWQ